MARRPNWIPCGQPRYRSGTRPGGHGTTRDIAMETCVPQSPSCSRATPSGCREQRPETTARQRVTFVQHVGMPGRAWACEIIHADRWNSEEDINRDVLP
ncbi:hypothetical protein DPEC_G00182420 [Dallia pectoralis]|uniref:Uncharacterized protein n=1 Tax=Dallia pectoralis TaxID=75939 RepID=A0ACC2GAS5_DALPE|nr:hypothetical protein DPEC_G00182420 [Dallia pectoralis]